MRQMIGKIVAFIWSGYVLTVMGAALYFNWETAKENGFGEWLVLGQIVPTAKALVWPYFAFSNQQPTAEEIETARYFVDTNAALAELAQRQKALEVETGRVVGIFADRMATDPAGAQAFLGDSMDVLLSGTMPVLSKFESIKTPIKLREHHSLIISCTSGQANTVKNLGKAIREGGLSSFNQAGRKFRSALEVCSGSGFSERLQGALDRAGFHSSADISKAIKKGSLKPVN